MENPPESEAVKQAKERMRVFERTATTELNLTGLGLTEQDLTTLNPSIQRLSNLRTLDISDIPVTFQKFQELGLKNIWGTVKANIAITQDRTYVGDLKWGSFNGQGELKVEGKYTYKGEFKAGNYHGQGSIKYLDGNSYEGIFTNGQITGKGTHTYPSGDVLQGNFEKATLIFEDTSYQKKSNTVPTLVVRSPIMEAEQRHKKYENDKHTPGGVVSVKALVIADGQQLIEGVRAMLQENKGTKTFKLAFNQHSGGVGGEPNIKLSDQEVRAVMQLLVDSGVEDIRISSHSCDLAEAKQFMDAAPDFTENARISVLTTPNGKDAYEGWKKAENGEKKFTSFYVTDEGEYAPRDQHIFEKQSKQEAKTAATTQGARATAFTTPLNQDIAKLSVGKPATDKSKLKPRKRTVHTKR